MHMVYSHGLQHHAVARLVFRGAFPRLEPQLTSSFIRYSHQLVPPIELKDDPNPNAKNIAVLGGGITGLTAAYHLQRTIPHAKITIYEKQERLGGWLNSEVVKVDGGEVLFEWGARSLRPDMAGPGLATIMLLVQLNMLQEALCIPKTSPAAINRYVYYPDHLVKMPGPSPGSSPLVAIVRGLYTVLTEPLFRGVLSAVLSEPAVASRPSTIADESVGSFIKRRFGAKVADNLVSAVFHGIYAGDIYKLSARTLLPSLWYAETRDTDGSGVFAEFADLLFKGQALKAYKDVHFRNLAVAAKDFPPPGSDPIVEAFLQSIGQVASVYTFPSGTAELGKRLKKALDDSQRVASHTGSSVTGIEFDKATRKVSIKTSDSNEAEHEQHTYDYVISTLSPKIMNECMQNNGWSETEQDLATKFADAAGKVSDAASVMVVNLYFSDPKLIPSSSAGFGYLIPRSIPLEQNPERVLGVIFGSETSGVRGPEAIVRHGDGTEELGFSTSVAEDVGSAPKTTQPIETPATGLDQKQALARKEGHLPKESRWGQDTALGTKLTVMMGGHWWSGWKPSDLPSEDEAIEMAKSVLARHLNISQAPLVAKARLNTNCIPQYPVGYRQRMASLHEGFLDKFEGRLKVAGPWWQGGVGVNDCTRKARLIALSVREQWDQHTGLEEYTEDEKWVLMDRRTGKAIMDPMQE